MTNRMGFWRSVVALLLLVPSAGAIAQTLVCGTAKKVADIPQAENSLFTPDGRLFVSGGHNVYEILADTTSDTGYRAKVLFAGTGNFTGLALRGTTLYAAEFTGGLYALSLEREPLALQRIHTLAMSTPNGMEAGPDGSLYIANTNPLDGKIQRVQLDPNDPFRVVSDQSWLSFGLLLPNGLDIQGDRMVVTDVETLPPSLGSVKKIHIRPNGRPGFPFLLSLLPPSLVDDLSDNGQTLLVALYTQGAATQLDSRTGQAIAITPNQFSGPSSARIAEAPLFNGTDWLITERGPLIRDGASQLSLFAPGACN